MIWNLRITRYLLRLIERVNDVFLLESTVVYNRKKY